MIIGIVKAVEAEIVAALAEEIGGEDFYGRAGISSDDVDVQPLRADISPDHGGKVGLGYALAEQAREQAMGEPLEVREFAVTVTVVVKAALGYPVLLMAMEHLMLMGPNEAGQIGTGADTVDVLQVLDNGDAGQDVDENGDFTGSRAFGIVLAE